jgi:hypothetical protein
MDAVLRIFRITRPNNCLQVPFNAVISSHHHPLRRVYVASPRGKYTVLGFRESDIDAAANKFPLFPSVLIHESAAPASVFTY